MSNNDSNNGKTQVDKNVSNGAGNNVTSHVGNNGSNHVSNNVSGTLRTNVSSNMIKMRVIMIIIVWVKK